MFYLVYHLLLFHCGYLSYYLGYNPVLLLFILCCLYSHPAQFFEKLKSRIFSSAMSNRNPSIYLKFIFFWLQWLPHSSKILRLAIQMHAISRATTQQSSRGTGHNVSGAWHSWAVQQARTGHLCFSQFL